MKHSILTLPALLRSTIYLASASATTFSVHDDLLAFPQYEVDFSEDFISESIAQAKLDKHGANEQHTPSHLEQYRPSDSRLTSDSSRADDIKFEYESMTLEGQRYLCSIPQISKPEDPKGGNGTVSKEDQKKELARANDRGWELLSGMHGNCVYYLSGWWSYRFCYNDGVRQFHQLPPSKGVPVYPPVEDPAIGGYVLGKYQPMDEKPGLDEKKTQEQSALEVSEKGKEEVKNVAYGELVQRGESRYLVQRLEGGTKCDLTGRERRVEVQFHCNPQSADRITLIKEISTCAYLMVIQTPRLCHDVAFLPPQKDEANSITCSPILAENEIDDYSSLLSTLSKSSQSRAASVSTAAKHAFPSPRQVVGDIVVGAHNIIPKDMKLEKSTIVGGGKETYIDTVATSGGKIKSKEELEKLGLNDPKKVEEFSKKLEAIAQGQEWKLDLIETANGREWRGIIGNEDDEKEKKQVKTGGNEEEEESEGEGSKEEYYKEEL